MRTTSGRIVPEITLHKETRPACWSESVLHTASKGGPAGSQSISVSVSPASTSAGYRWSAGGASSTSRLASRSTPTPEIAEAQRTGNTVPEATPDARAFWSSERSIVSPSR